MRPRRQLQLASFASFVSCALVCAGWLSGALAFSPRASAERGLPLISSSSRVRIAAGSFAMGTSDAGLQRALKACALGLPAGTQCDAALFVDERPEHEVHLRTYFIDRMEVSQGSYLRCVAAGACVPSGLSDRDERFAKPEQPIVQVTWQDARRYCRHLGGDLPTEAQWERAARGGSARAFPWGEAWNDRLANHGAADDQDNDSDGYRFTAPVDAFPDGHSYYGLLNMAGNVWELVLDRYAGPYDASAPHSDPTGPESGSEHVIRGGSWRSPPLTLRTTFRAHVAEDARRPDVGFRCAYPGPPPEPLPASPSSEKKPADSPL